MKKWENSILIEKNIETVWKKLTISENNLRNFFHKLNSITPININDGLKGSTFDIVIKQEKDNLLGKLEIVNVRDEEFWKEMFLNIVIEKNIVLDLHIELTVFESEKDKTFLKIKTTSDFKSKVTQFKNFINTNFLKGEKLDVEIRKILEELKYESEF